MYSTICVLDLRITEVYGSRDVDSFFVETRRLIREIPNVYEGVHAKLAANLIAVIICKVNLFVNIVRSDLDMMLRSDLPRAPQLASPLLATP